MAVRNIMVLFSSNVNQFARDMEMAAAATGQVVVAGDRLAMSQAKNSVAQARYSLQSVQGMEKMAVATAKQTEAQNLANKAAAQQNMAMQRGPAGQFVTNASAEGQAAIAAAQKEQAAQQKLANGYQEATQKERIALQQKNLAAQASSQSVIRAAQTEQTALKASADQRFATIGRIGKAAALIGAVGVGLIAETINLASKFQSEMSQAAAISDFTSAHLQQMSAAILRIGAVTPVSIAELVKGLVSAEQAGFQGAQALALVKLGAEGAVVGMTDASSAIKGISTVLTGFSLGIGAATNVNNILIAAVRHGIGTYGDFANALTQVGPAAKAAGVSINDTAAAIAVMSKKGLDATTAGTGIGRILVQLARQGTPAERTLTNLANRTGAYNFENGEAVIKGLGLVGTLQLIGKATDGSLTKLEQFIPNIRQIRASLALLDSGGKDVVEMQKLFESQTNLAVESAKAYAARLQTTSSQMQIMKNNLNEAGIAIGQTFLPVANQLIEWVTKLATGFGNLTPGYQKFIEIFVGGFASLLLFGGIVGMVVSAFHNLSNAASAIGSAFTRGAAERKAAAESTIQSETAQVNALKAEFDARQLIVESEAKEIEARGLGTEALRLQTGAIAENTAARMENAAAMEADIAAAGMPGGVTTPGGLIVPRGTASNAGTAATSMNPAGAGPFGTGTAVVPGSIPGVVTEGEQTAGMFSRAGSAMMAHPMLTGAAGLGLAYGAFQAQHHLSGAPKRAANILGDTFAGASAGFMLGGAAGAVTGPADLAIAPIAAIAGGVLGLGKGLLNLGSSGKGGPDSQVKAWQDALSQESSGATGMGQQQLFQNLATTKSGGSNAIDNFSKIGVNIQGVSDAVLKGTQSTDAAKKSQDEWYKSLGLTNTQLSAMGVSEKEGIKLKDDVKRAMHGDTGAAEDLKSRLFSLGNQTDQYGTATGKLSDKQILAAHTLKAVSVETDKHSKAIEANKKEQQDMLPAVQAANSAMLAGGQAAGMAGIQYSKLPDDLKKIVDAFKSFIDPTAALASAVKDPINIAMQGTADFATFQETFQTAQKSAQSAIDAQASASAAAQNKTTSNQQSAARAAASFQTAANARAMRESNSINQTLLTNGQKSSVGTKIASIEMRAGTNDAIAQMREQAAAQTKVGSGARVTAKQIKDSFGNGGVAQVSLSQFTSEMIKTVGEQQTWNDDLKAIAEHAASAQIPISDLLTGLEKLGKPGEAMTHELATGSIDQLRQMAQLAKTQANTGKALVSDVSFKMALDDQIKEAMKWKNDLGKVMDLTGGHLSPVAALFEGLKDKPGAADALHSLAAKLVSPDQSVRTKALTEWQSLAVEIASKTGQDFALQFAAQHDVVGGAINELIAAGSDPTKRIDPAAFTKSLASALKLDPKDPIFLKALRDNLGTIVAGTTEAGVGIPVLKGIFGSQAVEDALKANPQLGKQIAEGVRKRAAAAISASQTQAALPFRTKIEVDTKDYKAAYLKLTTDLKTNASDSPVIKADEANLKRIGADAKQLQRDMHSAMKESAHVTIDRQSQDDIKNAEAAHQRLADDTKNGLPPEQIRIDKKDYDAAIAKVEADRARFVREGKPDLNKTVLSADHKAVDAAFGELEKQRKIAHNPVGIRIATEAWDKAKKKLHDDDETLRGQINKPMTTKLEVDSASWKTYKDTLHQAIKLRDSVGGTIDIRVKANDGSSGSSGSSSSGRSSSPSNNSNQIVAPVTRNNPNPIGHVEVTPDGKSHWVTPAHGGFLNFADGGTLPALPGQAQIRKAGTVVQWAEPETGGEAFIPMATSKRARSLGILHEVAKSFGLGLTQYAEGGFNNRPMGASMIPGQGYGEPKVIVIHQKIPQSQKTSFQFGDISGPSMKDVQRFAEQKARMTALRGDG